MSGVIADCCPLPAPAPRSLLLAPCSLLLAPCSLLPAEMRSLELYSLLESATLGLKARFFRAPVLRAFSCRRAYLARLDEIIS